MNNNRKLKIKKMMKKGATISLCAVLAGGIGVGAYEGVNYFSGAQSVQAATDSSEKLTLMKSEKKSEDTEEADTKSSDTKGSLDVSDVAEEAMPSVVAITTKSVQEVQNYYSMFGSQYAPSQEQEVQGSGSGIIIGKTNSELLIATNYHVVDGADTLSVAFADGSAYEATVKGFDENEDLAVVSVATKDVSDDTMDAIAVAKIGSSDDLKIGEQVVAIGNALGYGQSVTTGIVSAKNRKIDSSGQVESGDSTDNSSSLNKGVNLIQTDAAINPGNSGGALLNMDGEVVGINSSKLASTEVEGMGYSIAISDVADSLENMMNAKARDKVDNHGILGITGSTVSDEAAQIYGIPQGVFVSQVTEDGPADKAGITKNMVITEFDGKTITSIDQLVELLQYYEPKEKIDVVVAVQDGNEYKEKTVTVKLGKDDSSDKSSSDESSAQDEQNSDSQDGSEQDEENAFANDGEASLFRDFEQNGLND
ncbi:trypsin-like peptidase domain-containing protein [Blautia sp. CLA-JM-H16]|uniref:Trypsin-like peptidase domain-containing protein n=1 Tax=Blautia aquisgranensis TaxID=3133153 RepID=A0ABV1BBY1_9FIRM